jgi:hypothetical protein
MGSSSSQETSIKEYQESLTSINTQQNFQSIVNNSNSCIIKNDVKLVTGTYPNSQPCPFRVIGNINVSQNANNVCQFTADGLQEARATAETNIRNTLEQVADSTNKSVQQFLSLASDNYQSTNVDTKTKVINEIMNSINVNDIYQCINNANIAQHQNIYLCGDFWGDIDLSQDAVQKSIASCNSKLINNAIAKNETLNSISQQVVASQESQQQGIFSPILAFFDALNNLFNNLKGFALAAVLIGIAILIIVLLVFIMFGPAKALLSSKKISQA